MKYKYQKGFTLIELVVVVSILALLAMMAMGPFINAGEKATIAADNNDSVVIVKTLNTYNTLTGGLCTSNTDLLDGTTGALWLASLRITTDPSQVDGMVVLGPVDINLGILIEQPRLTALLSKVTIEYDASKSIWVAHRGGVPIGPYNEPPAMEYDGLYLAELTVEQY